MHAGAYVFFSLAVYLVSLEVICSSCSLPFPASSGMGLAPSPAACCPCASRSNHPFVQRPPAADTPCPPATQCSPWSPLNCHGIPVFVPKSPQFYLMDRKCKSGNAGSLDVPRSSCRCLLEKQRWGQHDTVGLRERPHSRDFITMALFYCYFC